MSPPGICVQWDCNIHPSLCLFQWSSLSMFLVYCIHTPFSYTQTQFFLSLSELRVYPCFSLSIFNLFLLSHTSLSIHLHLSLSLSLSLSLYLCLFLSQALCVISIPLMNILWLIRRYYGCDNRRFLLILVRFLTFARISMIHWLLFT